jgi:DHA2 family multidrug resistance protein-like MFS transporter
VPADAAGTASDTLAGAVVVADRLPQLLPSDVLESARAAFTQAFQVAATVSGLLVVAAAVMVARLLRSGGDPHVSEAQEIARTATVAIEQPCA